MAAAVEGGPTPPQEDQPTGAYATYLPHDLRYSADFEDSLIALLIDRQEDRNSSAQDTGIRILPADSAEQPITGASLRATDLSLQSLPTMPESDLPLPIDDARRIFASPIPGLKLTHPGGYLEGGPGLDPDLDTFPDDFVAKHAAELGPGSTAELSRALQDEVEAGIEVLRERLRKRKAARERNEQVEKELRVLMDQHGMELKIQRRLAEEGERKKESRERRRRREREGG